MATHETMVGTPAVSNLIREARRTRSPSSSRRESGRGVVQLDQSILAHLMGGLIDGKEGYAKAMDKALFQQYAG